LVNTVILALDQKLQTFDLIKNIVVVLNGEKIESGRKKLGVVMGDNT